MQSRTDRHQKILELIEAKQIRTQAQLQEALSKSGFEVNQATLSRDIRELGLVKIVSGGRYRYASRQNISASTTLHTPLTTLKRFVHDVDWSGNIVVIKTDSGAASHVAEAIDNLDLEGLLGSIAGDNTIFLTVRRDAAAQKVVRQLQSLLL
ncbi:MAG TPA: arginine repressor [Candidatus Obscuribacterales bacterium]